MHKRTRPKRRFMALMAAASLWILIGASIAVAQSQFDDVPENHVFAKEI